MEHARQIIEGRYLQDILAQPAALQTTLDALHFPDALLRIQGRLQDGSLKRIVLTGMGSSFYSLTPLQITLSNFGYEVVQAETSELIHYLPGLLNRDSLVLAVSQSGRSAEIIRLLELNARKATLLGITNDSLSPLASGADAVVLMHAGEEFSVSSKTYVCTLAVLQAIAGLLCGENSDMVHHELLAAVSSASSYLGEWRQHVSELASHLEGVRRLFFTGRGGSLAAAGTGALITKESVGVHAEAMSSAAFRHGPMEMLRDDTFVGVLEGAPATKALNEKLVADVRAAAAKAELIGYDAELQSLRIPPFSARITCILEALPFQMLTIALGYLAGVEAGVFQRGTKVTVIE